MRVVDDARSPVAGDVRDVGRLLVRSMGLGLEELAGETDGTLGSAGADLVTASVLEVEVD